MFIADSVFIPFDVLRPRREKILMIFTSPDLRPPILEEMMPDIERLAYSIAQIRQDQTCFALQAADLVAECMLKLAHLVDTDRLSKIKNRKEAFKFVKTVFNNHCKSLVAKYRLTGKRGYQKHAEDDFSAVKNTDLSLDDPEQPVHIADTTANWDSAENFIDDISPFLSPLELLVLKEYDRPGERTRFFSDLSYRENSGTKKHVYKITEKHYSAGLGLDEEVFHKVLINLQEKLRLIKMKDISPEEIKWNVTIARLEEVFGIIIPRSIEKQIVKRCLTLAAVDMFDKVEGNPQVIADLLYIGAKIPEKRIGTLSCFGILYQEKNNTCNICGAAPACKSEAVNHGLGDVTIDPRLLGAKQIRVPTLVADNARMFPILTVSEEKVYNFLMENFVPEHKSDGIIFSHPDVPKISVVMQRTPFFELRLSNPGKDVENRLEKKGNKSFIPPDTDPEEAIDIIKEYSHEIFSASI